MNTEKKLNDMIEKIQDSVEQFNAYVESSETNEHKFEAIQVIKEIFEVSSKLERNTMEEDYSELEQLWFDNKLDD